MDVDASWMARSVSILVMLVEEDGQMDTSNVPLMEKLSQVPSYTEMLHSRTKD